MTQVAAKKKLDIRNDRVTVKARFHEAGSVLRGDAIGACDGFEITVAMDSDEPAEALTELLRLAHEMCFTEVALASSVQLEAHHFVNGALLE